MWRSRYACCYSRTMFTVTAHVHCLISLFPRTEPEILINHYAQSQVARNRRVAPPRPSATRSLLYSTALRQRIVKERRSNENVALCLLPSSLSLSVSSNQNKANVPIMRTGSFDDSLIDSPRLTPISQNCESNHMMFTCTSKMLHDSRFSVA